MTMEQRTGIIYSSKLPVLTSRYAFRPKQLQPLPNIMEKVSPQSSRSRSVMFYKNGDKFFQGHHVVLTQRKYRSFDSLLNELTRVTKLPHGVRYLLTPTSGRRINSLEQLEDGRSYIASSFSKLRRIHYGPIAMKNNENLEPLNHNKKEILTRKVDNIRLKPLNYNPDSHRNEKQRSISSRAPVIKPRLITVVRNGFKPRRIVKVLLNRRTAQNFEQVLDDVTSAVGVIGGSGVRKLFTVEGKQVQGLSDLLNSENDVFIAVGDEKFYGHDLQDILKDLNQNISASETKPTKHHKRHSRQEHESIKFTNKDENSNISHGRVSIKDDASMQSVSSNNNSKTNQHAKLPHINETDQGSHPKDTDFNTTAKHKDNVLPPIHVNNNEEKDRNSKNSDSDKISSISSPRKVENEKSPRNESKLDLTPEEAPEQKKSIENIREMFEIGKKLGDGNFAVVRECVHKTTNEKYALKIIDRSKLKGKEKMLDNEIQIMKRCNHANIVKLFDDFHARTEIYLVMELVQGGDLFDAISTSVRFTEPVAANYLHDVCSSLHYLHKRKIVHRDLKPENLLVCEGPTGRKMLKLADFGLAMEVKEPIYTVCGTPTYVAPEILRESGYGLRVDMWAAGVIAYIMLCGFPPFRSAKRRQSELFDLIQSGMYEFLSPYWDEISDDAKDFVAKLLVVDIPKRSSAEQALNHHWVKGRISESRGTALVDDDEDILGSGKAISKFKATAISVQSVQRLKMLAADFKDKRGEKLLTHVK